MESIAVIGSGICGLTTAYSLVEKGYQVTLYAKDFPPETTSNRAAAFWFPYHIESDSRCIRWSQESYTRYVSFLTDPASGVSMRQLLKVTKNQDPPADYWLDFMPAGSFRSLENSELPKGYDAGYDIWVPLVESHRFLPWLLNFLGRKGVELVAGEIKYLNELTDRYTWVINCTGLGARELCQDKNVYPIRGQVALLEPQKEMPLFLYEEQPFYIVPREDATLIGGTFEEQVWDTTPEPETIERLYKQAIDLYPQLTQSSFKGSWSGLRPFRKVIRVEREAVRNIIHNYGHGGSGFTLAWGCAAEVLELIGS